MIANRSFSRVFAVVCFAVSSLLFSCVAFAQAVDCRLGAEAGGVVTGNCQGPVPPILRLRRGEAGSGLLWVGELTDGSSSWPVDITRNDYQLRSRYVLRSPAGWFVLDYQELARLPDTLTWKDRAPPSVRDLQIILVAGAMIKQGLNWNRADDRQCDPRALALSLYCALAHATDAVTGDYQHRQPALQVVREIIRERWPERLSGHRLMDFNNHPNTTFADMERLFELAERRVHERME